jgi:dTDP-glucose 4,6-dehydratase
MSETYLITGGAGFIGSNFVHHIYDTYPDARIIVLDLLTYAGNVRNLPVSPDEPSDRFEFVYGDVQNVFLVKSLVAQADYVIHFAAETHVTRSIYDDRKFFETDIMGTQTVANAVLSSRDSIKKFIHISTSEVYGTSESDYMYEDHALNPASPYAAAKVGADRLVYSYIKTYDLPATIIRPFNNYGPRQHLEKVIPRFITSCLLDETLNVHGKGLMSRDWIYVKDTCEAIDTILRSDNPDTIGTEINVGTSKDISVLDIAKCIIDEMEYDSSQIRFIDERPGQVGRHCASINKMKELTGWEPKVSFEEGLRSTIMWYQENRQNWENQIWLRHVPITLQNGKKVVH